ncbi:hypothetical protein [Marinicrinis sediminis]|uniref:Uncharacterized protein n=1 Tax=Marinicrinis sediminis TaxID=1652465 RepID=A0ABW5RFF0_9BACL
MILWQQFDQNEWSILIGLIAGYLLIFLLPHRIPARYVVLSLLWGFCAVILINFTIGGGLLDYFVVNDSDRYEWFDLMTYFMFAPFSYLFIYFYDAWNIQKQTFFLYVLGWTVLSMVTQIFSTYMGMTHYQNGYKESYNVLSFLIIQTITGLYYMYLKQLDAQGASRSAKQKASQP